MPNQFHSILASPFNLATALYQLKLKGGCTLIIPTRQSSYLSDAEMKQLLVEAFFPFVDSSTS